MEYLAKVTGLRISTVVFDSDYKQFVVSEGYSKDIQMIGAKEKGTIALIKRKLLKLKYSILARRLNARGLGDLANFYFVKPGTE